MSPLSSDKLPKMVYKYFSSEQNIPKPFVSNKSNRKRLHFLLCFIVFAHHWYNSMYDAGYDILNIHYLRARKYLSR